MAGEVTGTWPGGFVRTTGDGRQVFYIHRRAAGRRWKKALDSATKDEALVELAAFLKDPAGYCAGTPAEPEDDAGLYLDAELLKEFRTHALAPRSENGRENSEKWVSWKCNLLKWWAGVLVDSRGQALDLRRVDLARHILPPLKSVKAARHRREAIKALYAWLAATGRIKPSEDPVVRLPVGQGRVAQTDGGKKKVVPREDVLKAIDYLLLKMRSRYGHALTVQAATGWHTTEVERFVATGEVIEPVPVALREPGVEAILSTPHKSGKPHYTKVGADAARSAKALLAGERGLSVKRYTATVRQACREAGVKVFAPSWMRHTNATHAVQQLGVSDDDAGKFLGHADGSMVRKVYGVLRTPPKVPTIMDEPGEEPLDDKARLAALEEQVRQLTALVEQLQGGKGRGHVRSRGRMGTSSTGRKP